jgi:hypothetical protein
LRLILHGVSERLPLYILALLQGKFSDDGASGDVRAVGNALKQQKEFNESMRESILESIAALVIFLPKKI